MKRHPKIIVAFDARWEWGRSILRGIAAFSEAYGPWDCDFTVVDSLRGADVLRINAADGLISRVDTPAGAAVVRRLRVPVVTVEDETLVKSPNVSSDAEAIGRMAAKHFAEQGLRRFAYYAWTGSTVSQRRGEAFIREVKRRGYTDESFAFQGRRQLKGWKPNLAHLNKWVKDLSKPVGIFCVGDGRAREVAIACEECKVSVPEEVAILGVSNDEFLCRLRRPQLSSIDPDGPKIGFEAARLLQRMLAGRRISLKPVIVPPLHVVVRQSSDLAAVGNPTISQAISFLRDQFAGGLNVKALVGPLAGSRRGLEMAFRRDLGHTIHEEIELTRFQRAAMFLVDGQMPVAQITELCGMVNPSQLSKMIRKHTGMTPLAYRREHQQPSAWK